MSVCYLSLQLACTDLEVGGKRNSPVSTRHRFDIHTTSITLKQRRTAVKQRRVLCHSLVNFIVNLSSYTTIYYFFCRA